MTSSKKSFALCAEEYIEKHYNVVLIIALILPIFNLFYKLGTGTIQDWDEARHGVTAYEMIKNNNFLVSTYGYNVDYYNLKPPLGMWAIALFYKIFGYKVFALRFFSALSSFLTILIVSKFLKDNISKIASIMGILILSTNYLFITWHAGRTGDFDAGLTLLFTICMYFLFKIDKSIKNFYICGFVFSLAFLLKSYATLQIIAVVGLSLLLTGKLFKIKFKEYIIFILCSFTAVFTWMALRYKFDGIKFLKSMITYDLLARSTSTIEGHSGNIFYYLIYFIKNDYYFAFFMAIIIGCYLVFNINKIKSLHRNFLKASIIIWAVIPFILFSLSKSKLIWYINTTYSALTILMAWICYSILKNKNVADKVKGSILIVLILSTLCGEVSIIHKIKVNTMPSYQTELINFGKNNAVKNERIYTDQWSQSNMFITEVLCGLRPKEMQKETFVKNKVSGLYLLENNDENRKFLNLNNCRIVVKNTNFIVIKQ